MFSGKKGLVLGIANQHSIAYHVAKFLTEKGARLGLSHLDHPKMESRVKNVAEELGCEWICPLDVSSDTSLDHFFSEAEKNGFADLDFILHSIAFADTDDIRCGVIDCSREGFKKAIDISAYSLIACANRAQKLFKEDGGSILTMTYLGGEKVVPGYNMMGICKAALDASVGYLAYDLGPKQIRVNAISAGPVRTLSASAIGDFKKMMEQVANRSPMKRNITPEEVAQSSAFLLSDLSTGITGEILHVDAGIHSIGM